MLTFKKNYLHELPEDIQTIIYKKVFNESLKIICNNKDALESYNKLVTYIKDNHYSANKNRAIWSIALCYRKNEADPYYKYFLYYADNETDFLRLNKTKMIRYDKTYSKIKYIDFSIYPIQDRVPTANYKYIKKILEEYASIFMHNYVENATEYNNIKRIELCNSKIRIEYNETYIFKCYIDIYNNIIESYNLISCILNILNMFNNHLYPEYNFEYMNDLNDLSDWFQYNSFFSGFTINDKGDKVSPFFYS
jgi:hypothetical protein